MLLVLVERKRGELGKFYRRVPDPLITGAPEGMIFTILHEDTGCTLNDTDDDTANQLDLNGSNGDLVGAADLTITLVFSGTSGH